MKKKLTVLAMALGLSAAVLTGCSKPTVESLVDGMFDKEIDSQTAEVDMDIVLSLAASGFSMDVSLGGNFEIQSSGLTGDDAQMNYISGELNMNAMGEKESAELEAYMVMEDGVVTSYVYNEDEDAWYKTEVEADDSDSLDQDTLDEVSEAMKDVLKENGELAEDTEKVEGEECYVITATIDGKDFVTILEPIMDTVNDALEEEADLDVDVLSWFEYMSMDVTYYISKDTGYQVKCEIDMSETDLYGMVEQVLTDVGAGDYGLMDMIEEVSFSECKISCVISDINDTEVEVPRDVIKNAVEAGDLDDIVTDIGGFNDPGITVDPDVDEEPPEDPDPVPEDDEWYHGDSFTFNKCDADNEFLCEVKIPDEFTYDSNFSSPDYGYVSLDRADGEGWIWIENELAYPTYNALLDGALPDDETDYENYEIESKVIGTAFGGSDVLLVSESYTNSGWDYDNIYVCIQYDDGGYKEFLTVDCSTMYDLDEWGDRDYLDLAVSLFGY